MGGPYFYDLIAYYKAYKLHRKDRGLEIIDPELASSAVTEQKPSNLEEPDRPGVPGSRYRRSRRPGGTSSTAGGAGTSGGSDSGTSHSRSNTDTATASTSASIETPR
ncbi:hypothetical protein OIU85_005920 [Salix viminalis]|uniref:Uncharacterized protein n=1 Tax=Salix viminalis TaxID=40686 RepID=A0A9Q0PJU3_SALVM|nr:hypothetical protein OIU85_005920 [Salix viminalis]